MWALFCSTVRSTEELHNMYWSCTLRTFVGCAARAVNAAGSVIVHSGESVLCLQHIRQVSSPSVVKSGTVQKDLENKKLI
jgi:hypothetical protein